MGWGDHVELVARRAEFLDLLLGEPHAKRAIVDTLDTSRSTANRAVASLEDAGLVQRTERGYVTTVAGRMALERHRAYVDDATDIRAAADVLAALPVDSDLPTAAVTGGDAHLADDPTPYRPLERLHDTIADADRYRALLPALDDPRHVRRCYEHVVTDRKPAELVVNEAVLDHLRDDFPRRLDAMTDADGFDLRVGDVPEYALVLTDADGETTVSIVAFAERGAVHGVIQNRTAEAVEWATETYGDHRAAASDATNPLGRGEAVANDAGATAVDHDAMPTVLEAQGFVQLDPEFFVARSTADPVTAWRTGLDLPEVHTGYAVDRTVTVDGEERSLTDELLDRLRDGTPCAVVGPPGSGKSTACKRVATEWYAADHGPVFYRAAGRGQSFSAVDALTTALEDADGHALVVVEDAVRPEARRVFDVLDAVRNRDDVSVLLDSRESEWHGAGGARLDADADALRTNAIETLSMPALLGRDCEALVERFEETVGEPVDVPLDQLREEVRAETRSGEAVPGGVLLLLHRASLYADPLAAGDTSFQDHVEAVYECVQDAGDTALDVAVLVNALNAAGVEVTRGLVAALGATEGGDTAAVLGALDDLEGSVVFAPEDEAEPYRTVHESWSVEFLAQLLDDAAEGEAERRVGRVLSAVLALADDPERRSHVRDAVASSAGRVEEIAAAPESWADATVEQLFALGERRPKLAPLFGDVDDPSFALPAACSAETALRCLAWRGRVHYLAGDYDRAEREYEQLRERTPDPTTDDEGPSDVPKATAARLHVRALLGLLDVAETRGDYDTGADLADRAVDAAHALGDDRLTVRAYTRSARVVRQEDVEAAIDRLEDALALAEAADDPAGELEALQERGQLATWQSDHDAAIEYKRRALDLARALGDRKEESRAEGNLGGDLMFTGDLAGAAERMARSLDISREMGDPQAEAAELGNLALVELKRGKHEQARERIEAALDIERRIDHERSVSFSLVTLAKAHYFCGDLTAAAETAREGVQRCSDRDLTRGEISGRLTLARVARDRGEYEDAVSQATAALEASEDVGATGFEVVAYRLLGGVARDRGEFEDAADHLQTAADLAAEVEDALEAGRVFVERAHLALDRGDAATARERFGSAAEQLTDAGAIADALDAMRGAVEACVEDGDRAAAVEWCERGRALADSEGFADDRAWFDERRDSLAERVENESA